MGVSPDHEPEVAESVSPTAAAPETDGRAVFCGGDAWALAWAGPLDNAAVETRETAATSVADRTYPALGRRRFRVGRRSAEAGTGRSLMVIPLSRSLV
jgi:hypothetical protein